MISKMNNKGFVARDFVIALILFSGVLSLAVLSMASLSDQYDNNNVVDEDFSNNFNRFENETQRASDIFNATANPGGISLVGTFDVLFSSTFTVISLVFGGVQSVGTQFVSFGSYFGFDETVTTVFFTILLSILAVLIVFIIISSVSRRDL